TMAAPPIPPLPFKKSRLLVAVSGGADSMALLRFLAAHPALGPKSLTVVHVNYGLRGRDSLRDEALVRRTCRALRIEIRVHRAPKPARLPGGLSLQDWARRVRYGFFAKEAKRARAWGCATAHHLEDQAETVLDRVIRGTGLRGLGAMRPVSTLCTDQGKVRLWRPLLALPKAELRATLKRLGQAWREDRTNRKSDYRRNILRRELLPRLRRLNPDLDRALSRLAETSAAEDDWMDRAAQGAIQKLALKRGKRSLLIKVGPYARLPLGLRRRVARGLAEGLNSDGRGLKFDRLEDIRKVWEGLKQGPLDLGYGLTAFRVKTSAGLRRTT
ncbi:MAG: tRNA lysidine(34) synthetase TilS, partial [Desulfobaccales bacterium]